MAIGLLSTKAPKTLMDCIFEQHRSSIFDRRAKYIRIGGPLVTSRAKPGQIVPVDSEHSALAQCLRGGTAEEVRRLVLTASGGPFRGRTSAELEGVTSRRRWPTPPGTWVRW